MKNRHFWIEMKNHILSEEALDALDNASFLCRRPENSGSFLRSYNVYDSVLNRSSFAEFFLFVLNNDIITSRRLIWHRATKSGSVQVDFPAVFEAMDEATQLEMLHFLDIFV